MKNQVARFTCGVEGHTLNVSIHKGKKDITTKVTTKNPEGKSSTGCRNYFDLKAEADAEKEFDRLCADAKAQGWELKATAARTSGFTEIPVAPTAPKVGPVAAPKAAAGGHRK